MHTKSPIFATILALTIVFVAFGGSPRTNAAYPGDNGRIAFVMRDGSNDHIWTMLPDGGDRQQLTSGAVRDIHPRFSPDGTMIAFDRLAPANSLWIMDADGGNPQPIPGTEDGYSFSWAPDGQMIVFEDFGDGVQTDLAVIGINGGGYLNLTQTGNTHEAFPDWSPDGERIAFQRFDPDTGAVDLWTMNADGSNEQQLTFTPDEGEVAPDWSPDSERIVYGTNPAGDIAVIDGNGGTPDNLTSDAVIQRRPVFSPDGDSIAFDENADTLPAGGPALFYIIVMDLGTQDRENISTGPTPNDSSADWAIVPGSEPGPPTWGDNDCNGAIDALDALYGFRHAADVEPAVPAGAICPSLGETISTASFGDVVWGDIDCDGDVDGDDAVLVLKHDADLPPANLQDCPAIGIVITPANI